MGHKKSIELFVRWGAVEPHSRTAASPLAHIVSQGAVTTLAKDASHSVAMTFYVCDRKAPNSICQQASPRSFDFAP